MRLQRSSRQSAHLGLIFLALVALAISLSRVQDKEASEGKAITLRHGSGGAVFWSRPEGDGGPPLKISADSDLAQIAGWEGLLLGFPLEINSAGTADLLPLPGVGRGTARAIIYRRNTLGGFYNTEDLKSVQGLGDVKVATLSKWLTFGD